MPAVVWNEINWIFLLFPGIYDYSVDLRDNKELKFSFIFILKTKYPAHWYVNWFDRTLP
jgi:hypothetical protein